MTHPKLRFVYFDAGMVLDTYPIQFVMPQGYVHHEPALTEWFIRNDRELCLGNVTLAEMWIEFSKAMGFSNSIIPDLAGHIARCHQPRKEMHIFANHLRMQNHIGLLTNMYPYLLPRLIEVGTIPPLDWFTAVIDSSEVHAVKPDRNIYEIATKQASVEIKEIGFVDDRLENVEAARDYGWTAWHLDIQNPHKTIEEMTGALLK